MLLKVFCAMALLAASIPCAVAESTTRDGDSPSPEQRHFDRTIAPLLAQHCLSCHSGSKPKGGLDLSQRNAAMKGGDSGPVLAPGKPDRSLLWKRIKNGEMPPKEPLSKDELTKVKAWIQAGAKWGTDPIDPFRFTTDKRAGYDWWSLQPVQRPNVPKRQNPGISQIPGFSQWSRNPIDAFILAKLRKHKLRPSPPASRLVLIRRLKFDLLGLPPAPDEVEAFLADRSPNAYEKLVDRYLASPQFGERWARHWLDLARFGESQGFERDKLRTNAWRYRDWVVNAFNADMPYDRFARLQIAGDVIRPGDPRAIIATGFLVAGPWDEVGQNQQSAAMKAVVRQDELEDVVSAVGQGFLGLTIHCARCHDHKFDPVRQEEYYRLTAALAGTRHGTRNIGTLTSRRQADLRSAALAARISTLRQRLDRLTADAKARILAARKNTPRKSVEPPRPLSAWDFRKSLKDRIGKLHVTPRGKAKRDSSGLVLDGRSGYAVSAKLNDTLTQKTFEVWVRLDNLTQRGGGVISLQTLDGRVFDAIVFGEREPGRWMAGSNHFRRTKPFGGPPDKTAAKRAVHVAITYAADGTIRGYLNGRPYGKPYRATGPVRFAAGKSQILFGLRHAPVEGNKLLAGRIERAKLYDRALTAREIAASAGVPADFLTDAEIAKSLSPESRQRQKSIQFEIEHLQALQKRWRDMKTYAVAPKPPGQSHLLNRGNPAQKGKPVTPGGVASLRGVDADFNLPGDAPDAQRRRKLAAWMTDPNNPLFARVIVNRLWQHHFGRGIVETPSDFGFNGSRPTHPELLDWLAAELTGESRSRTQGFDKSLGSGHAWSLKHIHRLIVTSATYRQSSRVRNPQSPIRNPQSIDADNRYLWRMTPRRLEAEAVRDAILAVAGELNPAMGGPGYYDFTTHIRNTQFYEMRDPVGRTFHRRSLYRTWVRSGRNRFLDAFDCPDPSTKTPRRSVTTTPVQSLALLNNSFVLRMSDRFAERIKREAGDDPANQITRCWQLVYGRPPETTELQHTLPFVKKHGLPALCRVVFNSNEFLFAD